MIMDGAFEASWLTYLLTSQKKTLTSYVIYCTFKDIKTLKEKKKTSCMVIGWNY